MLLCVATLLVKLLVPAGYMISGDHGRIALTLCSGVAPQAMAGTHGAAHDAGHASHHGKTKDHGKAEMPCAFAGLTAASTGAIDPIQLAALIAFIMIAGISGVPALPARACSAYLRPPLRGPPASL